MDLYGDQRLAVLMASFLLMWSTAAGDLEPTLGRCCAYGANWARESQACSSFPTIMTAIPTEHRSVCITAAAICCLRYFRDEQCQKGKQVAQVGQDCMASTSQGGEYFKDCCQGCKLGLFSGSMGMGCSTRFKFGIPWDYAYLQCCSQATSSNTSPDLAGNQEVDSENLYPGLGILGSQGVIPDSENLCAKLPGKLCSDLCVPTPGSYRCMCRAGFSLSVDGKTCIQDTVTDRCQVNNPCDHVCRDTGVSIVCSCNRGFTLKADQKSCEDVDECVDGTNNCNWTTHFCVNTQGGYMCEEKGGSTDCVAGYKFSIRQNKCIDIDECAENLDNCDGTTQTCVNSKGSFRCIDRQPTCDFGYRYNEDQETCVDIDECAEGRDFCNKLTEVCVNSEGSYWCSPILDLLSPDDTNTLTTASTAILKPPPLPPLPPKPEQAAPQCPLGTEYSLLFQACIDIDECDTNPCKSFEDCENTQGSYQCQCQLGYRREEPDEDCQDMNECQLELHTCTSTQRCDNTIGSYVCVRIAGCGTGYTLNHNTGLCDDNDECKLNTHNCDQRGPKYECVNTKGFFRCKIKTCPPRHILNDDGLCIARTCNVGYKPGEFDCIDINECIEDNPCRQNERCINTLGSYRCRPLLTCNIGYEMNEEGTQCIDVDECARGIHHCEGNQICSNRQGSYICNCPQGYRLNVQRQCEDINECESFYGRVCANNANCENTEGSFRCNCKEGFKQANNAVSCIDVDECLEVPEICHHNCINVWGTYQCTCRAGFILDSDNRTCTDVDECEAFRGRGHLCIGLCVNIPGSFKCTCPDGYSLAADGRTCKDINECESGSTCRGIDEQCVNTRGDYKCNKITCPNNYVRDQHHKNRCKKLTTYCPPNDEECSRKPLSYSYNYLPLVSNMTLSSLGQVDLFTMRGPLWASTTVQFELELEDTSAPANVEPVTREYFQLRRTAYNQAVISLVKSIIGPQEIQLSLNMQLYQQGRFSGSAVAKLLVYVSEHTF